MANSPKMNKILPEEIHAQIGRSVTEEIMGELQTPAEKEEFVKKLREQGFSDERIKELFPEFTASDHNHR